MYKICIKCIYYNQYWTIDHVIIGWIGLYDSYWCLPYSCPSHFPMVSKKTYPKGSLVRLECYENHEPWGTFLTDPLVMTSITMENHHWNSEFTHEKWWIFPSFFVSLPEGKGLELWQPFVALPSRSSRSSQDPQWDEIQSLHLDRWTNLRPGPTSRKARRKTREVESTANGYRIARDSWLGAWVEGWRFQIYTFFSRNFFRIEKTFDSVSSNVACWTIHPCRIVFPLKLH